MKKTKVPTKKSQPKLTSFFAKTTVKKTNSQTNSNDKENVEPTPSAPVTPNRLSQKLSENLKVSVTQPESPVSNPKRKEPEKSESPDKKPEACAKKDNIEEKDEPLQPKNKRRKVTVAFSDSEDDNEDDKNVPFSLAGVTKKLNSKKKIEDSDDDFKPETQESASDEVMDEDDFELESEKSANSDNSEDFAETKKTKKSSKSSKSKQTTPSRPTTPKLKENTSEATTPVRSVSPNTSALSQFRRATPSPNPGSRKNVSSEKNASKEKVQKYFHETLKFLKPEFIKDKMKRRPDHADYDPGTLFIPENGLEKKTPPMTHQFFKLKEDQFDTIFMFKVGKFYEFYHTDAQIAINVLGLKKQNGDNLKCGFPEMACDRYMRALVEAGYKVARVEQTETTAELADRKGDKSGYHWETKTVIREIVSIATAGTVSSANAFDFDETDMGKAKNFFFSVFIPDDDSTRIGIVALHSGRGEWFMTFLEDDDRYHSKLLGILSQFKISQVIFPKKTTDKRKTVFQRLEATGTFVEKRVDRHFWKPEHLLKFLTKIKADWKDSDELFKSYFNMGAEPNSENGGDVILPAFAALCQYFEECKLAHVVLTRPLLNKLSGHSGEEQEDSKMVIDAISQKNLDLDHMFKRINYTRTDFGQRQLHDWMQAPIMNISKICKRQECIKYLLENLPLRQRLIDGLLTFDNPKRGNKRMPDIPTLLQRLKALSKENVPKNHPMNRAQIYEIVRYSKNQLDNFCKLLCIFEQIWDEVVSLQEDTENMPELLKQILTFGGDHSFSFPDLSAEMKSWKKRFDRKAAIETGKIVPKRKSDEKYNALLCIVEKKQEKLNDFAAEVAEELGVKRSAITFETKPKKPHMFVLDAKYEPRLIEADWLIVNSKKETKSKPKLLVVQRKSDQMAVSEDLAESELELEEYVRNQNNIIFIQWIESAHKWLQAVEALKLIDCLVSLSCYIESETDDMVIPNFEDSKDRDDALLELVKSRHPCMNLAPGQQLVANSAEFSKKVMILTGPNMGGKSTIMRQVALNVVLAQMGSYVPAESMNLTPVDRIFTRIGGSDHMIKGESTFYVELSETASILQHATLNSFVIIDELGRGTATHDGCAIARAVYQELVEMNVMSIVSTHYHSLVEEIQKNKVDNLQLAFMDCHETICPTSGKVVDVTCMFELAEGICPQSHGFACARKAFIAESVIEKGQKYANELEDITKVLTQITRMFS